jgi:hypothetical protein
MTDDVAHGECYVYLSPLAKSDGECLVHRNVYQRQKVRVLSTAAVSTIARYLRSFISVTDAPFDVRLLVVYRPGVPIQVPQSLTIAELASICNKPGDLHMGYSFVFHRPKIQPGPYVGPFPAIPQAPEPTPPMRKVRPEPYVAPFPAIPQAPEPTPPRPTRIESREPIESTPSLSLFTDSWQIST